jgi:hypothetical protein
MDRFFVCHLDGIAAWPTIFLPQRTCPDLNRTNHILANTYQTLQERGLVTPSQTLMVSSVPYIRSHLKQRTFSSPPPANYNPLRLHTTSERIVDLGERQLRVRDVIETATPEIRDVLQAAKSFSLVATPYIQNWSLVKGLNNEGPAYLSWPVVDESQISLHT